MINHTNINIDLVYLWVDGNDPNWIAKHNKFSEKTKSTTQTNCKGRFADNNELKYSLRSVEAYAPWIRKIFIVTDHQTPAWLNTQNPKIRIVDHTEIMPAISLPCFNSRIIEHCIYMIPGLAEKFLYANDDMFFNRPVTPDTFFAADGLPIIRFNHSRLRNWYLTFKEKCLGIPMKNYVRAIRNSAELVKNKYGIFYSGKTHHNIDAYLKSDYQHTRKVFEQEIEATLSNHIRSNNDIQRNIYSYVPLAEGRGHLVYVSQKTSFRFHIQNRKHYKKLEKYNPILFCMNDSEYANDNDRKRVTEFLNQRFPNKSQFEK